MKQIWNDCTISRRVVQLVSGISITIWFCCLTISTATEPPPTGALAPKQLGPMSSEYFASSLTGSAFSTAALQPILLRASATRVSEIYVLPATQEGDTDLKDYKGVYANEAARLVFGSSRQKKEDDVAFIELARHYLGEFSESLQKIGIEEGFVSGKLYLILPPIYFHPEVCRTSGLLFEHWYLYVLSPSGRIAPVVNNNYRSTQAITDPTMKECAICQ
ncbi:MAG: hypothetical protein H8K07_06675 [Nitrospira sp.]|nr:hypothetical protein [Nitrospira sp.]